MEFNQDIFEHVRELTAQVSALQQELSRSKQQSETGKLVQMSKSQLPDCFENTSKLSIDAWLFQVESFPDFESATYGERILFATRLLKGNPLDWWRSHKSMMEQGHVKAINSWKQFKEIVLEKYRPFNSVQNARDRLAAARHSTTVEDYVTRIRNIALEIPGISLEEMRDRFIRGLKEPIRSEVRSRDPVDFDGTTQLAIRLETAASLAQGESAWTPLWQPSRSPVRPSDPMELDAIRIRGSLTEEERNNLRQKGCCFYCRESGHIARYCPKKGRIREGHLKVRTQ